MTAKFLSVLLGLLSLVACGGPTSSNDKVAETAEGQPGEQIQRYLDANNIDDEVTTSSGLVYMIEKQGGVETPTLNDRITIRYKGYLVDGTVFDQTRGASSTFYLNQLIAAWQEAIPLIGRDGKIKILAPPSIAYGNRPPPGSGITPQSVLVFDIELIDF